MSAETDELKAAVDAALPSESFRGERVMQAVRGLLPGAKVVRLARTARGKWLMLLNMDECAPGDGSVEPSWLVLWTWFGDEVVRMFVAGGYQDAVNQFYSLAQVSRAQCIFFEEVPA